MNIQISDIGHVIQLAIAPVFLLTGVGTKLTVLINRLARIIDRSRILEERLEQRPEQRLAGAEQPRNAEDKIELGILYRRAHLIHVSITLSTACALLICLVIVALFVGDALNAEFSRSIAAFFVLSMLSLIGSYVCLLREIFIATHTHLLRTMYILR
jgi:hypothetical protein